MRKMLVLLVAVLAIVVTSTVPAAAQADREATCVFFGGETGYFCSFGPLFRDIDLRCPAAEPAEEGDVLNCRSIDTGERFTCTVVEEIIDGFVIRVSCGAAGEEQPGGAAPPGVTAPPVITDEIEQEAESGDVDLEAEVS